MCVAPPRAARRRRRLGVRFLILSLCVIAAPRPGRCETPSVETVPASAPRTDSQQPLHQVQDEVRRAIRADVQAKNSFDERVITAWRMIQLHRRIVADPRFTTSDTLQGLRDQVAARLLVVQADVKRQIHREQATAARGSANRSNVRPPRSGASTVPVPADAAAGLTADDLADSLADHLTLVGSTTGGPARLLAFGNPAEGRGGGAMGPPDNGPALVDLIRRTIHPESWDVNGGHGTIQYFYPLRCLVVRATREVHGEMGDLVQDLRGAGP